MELRKFKNIIGLKTDTGELIGFHSQNLEVAAIDELTWQAFAQDNQAQPELKSWDQEQVDSPKEQPLDLRVRSFTINISQVCNLKCDYCGAGGDGTYGRRQVKVDVSKATEQIQKMLEPIKAGESFSIRFLGGEPLLYPTAIREIANYAKLMVAGREIDLNFSIVTNGTLITPKVAEMLAELECDVTISLDGSQEVNDKNRKLKMGGSSTVLTLKGIEQLVKHSDRIGLLRINSVFGAHNIEVVKTYQSLKHLPADVFNFNYAAGEKDDEFSIAYLEQMKELARVIYKEHGYEGLKRIAQFRTLLNILENQTRRLNFCGAGKSHLQMDTGGELYTCNWMINDKSEALSQNGELDQQKKSLYHSNLIELNQCQNCWAKYLCGGGCMFVNKYKNGDRHKSDDHFCQRRRSLSALAIHYFYRNFNNN